MAADQETTDDSGTSDLLTRVASLRAERAWDEAAQLLESATRARTDVALESAYLQLQHSAFADAETAGPAAWPTPVPDLFADRTTLPEVHATELTAEHLNSALQHHGSLIVREFMPTERLAPLRDMIDLAFEAMAAWEADNDADHSPWFVAFEPDEGYSLGGWERLFVTYGGGVHAVDAPRAWCEMVDALKSTGVGDVIADYFGERPALSAKKTTLRRAEPDSRSGWHQDGAFLGANTRSCNIWTTLTDSGVRAPGLDVIHKKFDDILETGTEGAQFTWSVSPDLARERGGDVLERPEFHAGDALMFDEKTLHQTGVDPDTMTERRYALETWFFAPSTYPQEQIPIRF